MKSVIFRFIMITGFIVFLSQCISNRKINDTCMTNGQLQKTEGFSKQGLSDSLRLLLVAESYEDSLVCISFLPNRESDLVFSFPPRPITYPEVSPVEKSVLDLEVEIQSLIKSIGQDDVLIDFDKTPVIVVFDAKGVARGLFMFVQVEKNVDYTIFGKTILDFLKKEKFSPGIDMEVEIGKPVSDIIVLHIGKD